MHVLMQALQLAQVICNTTSLAWGLFFSMLFKVTTHVYTSLNLLILRLSVVPFTTVLRYFPGELSLHDVWHGVFHESSVLPLPVRGNSFRNSPL